MEVKITKIENGYLLEFQGKTTFVESLNEAIINAVYKSAMIQGGEVSLTINAYKNY